MGRLGLQTGTPSNITVGTSSTAVLTDSDTELLEYISIVNDSIEDVYIAFGAAAEMNKGILLTASGGSVVFEGLSIPKCAINAICSTGSKNLCLQTGV